MKLCRLWKIIIGKDDELAQAQQNYRQEQEELRASTGRLDAATEDFVAKATETLNRDKKAEHALSDLKESVDHG